MKNKVKIIILLFVSVLATNAQIKQVSFKDGTEMEYEVLESTSDNAVRGVTKICIGSLGLGYEYSVPKKFVVQGGVGDGIYLDGMIALKSWDKEKNYTLTLKSVSTGANSATNYVVKDEKQTRTNSFGVHAGGKSFFKVLWPNYGTAFFGGVGFYTTGHVKYFVKEKNSGKSNKINITQRRGIYIDYYYLPNYISSGLGTDPVTGNIVTVDTKGAKTGIGITWVGTQMASKRGKRGAGLCTIFGIGKIFNAPKGHSTIFSLGIGVCF